MNLDLDTIWDDICKHCGQPIRLVNGRWCHLSPHAHRQNGLLCPTYTTCGTRASGKWAAPKEVS